MCYILKSQQRRQERKNRDEFRKMMEDHVATGILTAKTRWHEYCMQVFPFSLNFYVPAKMILWKINRFFLFWWVGKSFLKGIGETTGNKGFLFTSYKWQNLMKTEF